MSNICLQKVLKAEVDNPNLPVIETIQQFTLDAIAISGNDSFTDAQTWALNHFFYQIGAIDNNTLWQKIKYLGIPMISGDHLATVYNDYKTKTVVAASGQASAYTFVNHGLQATGYNITDLISGAFNGASNNLTSVFVDMLSGIADWVASNVGFYIDNNTSNRIIYSTAKVPDASKISGYGEYDSLRVEYDGYNVYDITAVTRNANNITINAASSQNAIRLQNMITTSTPSNSYTDGYVRFRADTNKSHGLLLVAEAMTSQELDKVINACKSLKAAFV